MIKTYLITKEQLQEDIPLEDWQSLVKDDELLWVDVRAYTPEDVETLARHFGLHSVAVDSCLDGYRRPHLYEFPDHFYVNLTVLENRKRKRTEIKPTELHLFVGQKWVLTLSQQEPSPAVDEVLNEYRETPAICERGPMHAVYLLLEYLVESYFPIVERLDDDADELETAMLQHADKRSLARLFDLKRVGFELRRILGPQRDVLATFARRDFPFIRSEQNVYFQDVYNRMIRIFDIMDTVREILSGSLDIYLSAISNRLNEVMKVLTIVATVLMTLSFITGFYGMNFTHLPWLRSPNAFRNMVIFMIALTAAMLWWFRRRRWL